MWHGRGQESLHLGRVEGEQLSSWKILVPMRLPRDPFSVRNVRRPWCAFAYEPAVKFKRRVQVTVLAGAFDRFAVFELAGRLLAVLGMRALSRPAIRHFETTQRLGGNSGTFETFRSFLVRCKQTTRN
jgi:hypothetical protein